MPKPSVCRRAVRQRTKLSSFGGVSFWELAVTNHFPAVRYDNILTLLANRVDAAQRKRPRSFSPRRETRSNAAALT